MDMSRSVALFCGPVGRREVLQEGQRGGQLERRVAVVVGPVAEYTEPLPALTQTSPGRRRRGRHRPSRSRPGRRPAAASTVKKVGRAAGLVHGDHPPPVGGAVPVVAAQAEHHPAGVQGQPGALQQRGGVGAGRVDVLGHLDRAGRRVSPTSTCAGDPSTSSSATTKISPRDGVDDRGAGDPDGGRDVAAGQRRAGTGVARCRDQTTAPVGSRQRVHRVVLGGHVHVARRRPAARRRAAPSSAGEVHAGDAVSTAPEAGHARGPPGRRGTRSTSRPLEEERGWVTSWRRGRSWGWGTGWRPGRS